MWKITWHDVTNYTIKEENYKTFEEARKRFRLAIKDELSLQIPKINEYIDGYCKEKFSQNPPRTFEQLKSILAKFVLNPSYPTTEEELNELAERFITFEELEGEDLDIFIWDNGDLEIDLYDTSAKFINGLISLLITPSEPSCLFFIEDNQPQFADNRIFTKIYLQDEDRRDEIDRRAEEEMDFFSKN